MVSVDAPERNAEFAKSLEANFVILSDPTREIAAKYGVLMNGKIAKRWSFYIDQDGVIQHVDEKVKAFSHGEAIVAKLGELGFPMREAE